MAFAFRTSSALSAFSVLAFSAAFSSVKARSRGVFSSGSKTLTFSLVDVVTGDVLLALIAHNAADAVSAAPAGWSSVATLGSGADVLEIYAHVAAESEPSAAVFSLATVANEWQGKLLALTGTSPGIVLESGGTAAFSGSTSLTTAGATVQQAIDLILTAWTCSGVPTLTLPAGFTLIDSFRTGIVSSRSMLIGYQSAGATGALTYSAATASSNTTGRSFTCVLRPGIPVTPAPLVDLVPGNIGLIARDTRPPR